MVINLMLM